jgi:hypothetical protein
MKAQVASVSIRLRSISGWKLQSKFSRLWPSGSPERPQRRLDAPFLPARHLDGEEIIEDPMRRGVVAHRGAQDLGQLLGSIGEAEAQELLARGVDLNAGRRRLGRHRATSARLA